MLRSNWLCFLGNPVTSLTGVNGSPNPLTLPGSGTTVFPLPGSFPWAAGARGKTCWKDTFQELRTQKRCVFDPMLVKPKCGWEAYIYFENCKQAAEKLKWIYLSQTHTHFGFHDGGSKVHRFWVLSSWKVKNVSGTPCRCCGNNLSRST